MKLSATVSFFLTIVSISSIVFAQISYYGIDTVVSEDGRSKVKLTTTFTYPVNNFTFGVIGRIENFNASSLAGPVDCTVNAKDISYVNCNLTLTSERRTVEFSFETMDFVIPLAEKFRFSGDFSLREDISQVFASVGLPERMALIKEDVPGRLSYPEYARTLNDGNIVVWQLSNIKKGEPLRLEILYERLPTPFWAQLRIRQVVIFAIVTAVVLAFFILRYLIKSEKMVLSVLDDFERRVMDIIMANEGEVNQRKVVQETNLSKAKVSRVVKSLAERGLIEVQRLGRTNKLKLVKKRIGL